MFRFFIGFAFGAILTVVSFGVGGGGHGTYAPLVSTVPFIMFLSSATGGIVTLLAGPLLWALYFQLIPKIKSGSVRLFTIVALLLIHLLPGIVVAANDPAFVRAWDREPSGLIGFIVIFTITLATLFFLSLRARAPAKKTKRNAEPAAERPEEGSQT